MPISDIAITDVVEQLRDAGAGPGSHVGIAIAAGVGVGFAAQAREEATQARDEAAQSPDEMVALSVPAAGPVEVADLVAFVAREIAPRWVTWSGATAAALLGSRCRLATCWDVAAVHRMLHAGAEVDAGGAWAAAHGLDVSSMPRGTPRNLFDEGDDGDDEGDPIRPDGYLRPDWLAGEWTRTPERAAAWASCAVQVAAAQHAELVALAGHPRSVTVARAESAAELLCREMSFDGLPMSRALAEEIIRDLVGVRPDGPRAEEAQRSRRDSEVLRHGPPGPPADLRSPAQVRSLLARVGIDVPDTRAQRLRALSGTHPLVDALLEWRKAERVATTYGYAWLDESLGDDGRLRGAWCVADGAAGRMTASAGLHNMPAELRPAVVADPGWVFVRADLGQIEPRVLAAVSGDALLARASREPDMYAPVAARLGVDRATAKVAVLGAMYGQTTGHGAEALRGLRRAYPVAMGYLEAAERSARAGCDLRTYGGRLVRMNASERAGEPIQSGARVAARGRYGRNAVVQGAAAELFKVWAATVRARLTGRAARIVLCLHDELLVHVPHAHGDEVVAVLQACLAEAVTRWAPDGAVEFVADVSVITCWSDAKP